MLIRLHIRLWSFQPFLRFYFSVKWDYDADGNAFIFQPFLRFWAPQGRAGATARLFDICISTLLEILDGRDGELRNRVRRTNISTLLEILVGETPFEELFSKEERDFNPS